MRNALTRLLQLESASGLLLIGAAVLAMTINNSPLSFLYNGLLDVPVAVQVGALQIAKPLLQLGLPDAFIEHGDPARLLALQGLDAVGIEASVRGRFGDLIGPAAPVLKVVG